MLVMLLKVLVTVQYMPELTRNRSLQRPYHHHCQPYNYFIFVLIGAQGRRNQYDWLEETHSYIQWLFPTREQSAFNDFSSPLTAVSR